jgi:hypothetical protein
MKIPLTPIRFLRYAREQFPDKIGLLFEVKYGHTYRNPRY